MPWTLPLMRYDPDSIWMLHCPPTMNLRATFEKKNGSPKIRCKIWPTHLDNKTNFKKTCPKIGWCCWIKYNIIISSNFVHYFICHCIQISTLWFINWLFPWTYNFSSLAFKIFKLSIKFYIIHLLSFHMKQYVTTL